MLPGSQSSGCGNQTGHKQRSVLWCESLQHQASRGPLAKDGFSQTPKVMEKAEEPPRASGPRAVHFGGQGSPSHSVWACSGLKRLRTLTAHLSVESHHALSPADLRGDSRGVPKHTAAPESPVAFLLEGQRACQSSRQPLMHQSYIGAQKDLPASYHEDVMWRDILTFPGPSCLWDA